MLNILNQVFAKISGASTWTKAVKYPTEYAEAANGATAANKELKKSILGIDEINPLQDNSSGSGGGGAGGMDYSSMFEEQELGDVASTYSLLSMMDISYRVFGIESSRMEYWVKITAEVQTMLRNWRKSDMERYKNMG